MKEYLDFYVVYSDGRVYSKRRNRFLKATPTKLGYMRLHLNYNSKDVYRYVHRIVAECFLDNPTNLKEVNHINGDKTDNRIENLEWVTRSQNQKHAVDTGLLKILKGEKSPKSKLTKQQVCGIMQEAKDGLIPQKKIAEKYGVSQSVVSNIKNRKTWKHI